MHLRKLILAALFAATTANAHPSDSDELFKIGVDTLLYAETDINFPATTPGRHFGGEFLKNQEGCYLSLKSVANHDRVLKIRSALKIESVVRNTDGSNNKTGVSITVSHPGINQIYCYMPSGGIDMTIGTFRRLMNGAFTVSLPEPRSL